MVEIIIHEGKNHQVKKMIEAVGKKVLKLRRERYAFFDLKGLKVGEYRKLSNKEIAVIYSMVKWYLIKVLRIVKFIYIEQIRSEI